MISDVDAFRVAWQAASAVVADEKPNAKLQVALDRLAEGVVARVAHGSTVQAALKPFLAIVKNGDAVSDPGSLDATAFRDGDRWLVNVRMGFASSVSAFGKNGRLALPPDLRWSYREFGSFFRTGGLIAFDATSLSDAGIRFGYRLSFLRRTPQGYASAGTAKGTWLYEGAPGLRLVAKGDWIILLSLDPPRAFFTDNATALVRRRSTWSAKGSVVRLVRTEPLDPVRAADDWLLAHRGKGGVPRELGMAIDVHRGKGWVELGFDRLTVRFDLALVGAKNVVRKATVKP